MARIGRTVREGLTVGLIGYGAVALFYVVFDVLAARGTAFTLNLLGKVLFRGARDPAILQLPIQPDVGAMVAYNFFHLLVSLAVGLFVAWVVARVEERPRLGYAALAVFVAGYAITVALVLVLARGIGPLLPAWTVVTVNTLAAVGGGAFLLHAHPDLWRRVHGSP